MPRPLAPLLLALLLPSPLLAGDDPKTSRTIALPREGLSVTVPAGWTLDQYGGGLLLLESGEASIRIARSALPAAEPVGTKITLQFLAGDEMVVRVVTLDRWDVPGARAACAGWSDRVAYGLVELPSGGVLEVTARVLASSDALAAQAKTVLASLDVTPFEHPDRHVDWKDGWTIDLPDAWVVTRQKERAYAFGPSGSDSPPLTITIPHPKAIGAAASSSFLSSTEEAERVAKSFRRGMEPGGRVAKPAAAASADRFDGDAGPKVVFALPEGWTKRTPASRMRIAEYALPGDAECVVFWFGGGDGGGFEANLQRWKGQFQSEAEPKVTEEEACPGIAAKVVDITGTYVAETSPGSGVRVNKPGFRMLAAVLTTPDGPLYVKLLGPEAAVAKAEAAFRGWLRSFRPRP